MDDNFDIHSLDSSLTDPCDDRMMLQIKKNIAGLTESSSTSSYSSQSSHEDDEDPVFDNINMCDYRSQSKKQKKKWRSHSKSMCTLPTMAATRDTTHVIEQSVDRNVPTLVELCQASVNMKRLENSLPPNLLTQITNVEYTLDKSTKKTQYSKLQNMLSQTEPRARFEDLLMFDVNWTNLKKTNSKFKFPIKNELQFPVRNVWNMKFFPEGYEPTAQTPPYYNGTKYSCIMPYVGTLVQCNDFYKQFHDRTDQQQMIALGNTFYRSIMIHSGNLISVRYLYCYKVSLC